MKTYLKYLLWVISIIATVFITRHFYKAKESVVSDIPAHKIQTEQTKENAVEKIPEYKVQAEQIIDKCMDEATKDDPMSITAMRKAAFAGNDCIEKIIIEKINNNFVGEYKAQVLTAFNGISSNTSDFYWAYYNLNKYCCNDNNCWCGTMGQLSSSTSNIKTYTRILESLIYLEINKDA